MPALDFPSSPVNGQTYGGYYYDAATGAWRSDPVPMGGLPAGSIIQWAGSTAPANWLMADGSAVSRSTYASLYAAIGVTYGAGDGSTTFNVPNFNGRVAVGKNSGTFGTLGATGGAESVTLTAAQSGLPAHEHNPAVIVDITPLKWAGVASGSGTGTLSSSGGTNNVKTAAAGPLNASEAHTNLQPYIVTNYIIKATAGWTAGDSELATRVGALEAAPAGLVRVVPTSVAVGSGSASVSGSGVVTFTGASSINLENVFSSTFSNYRLNVSLTSNSNLGDALAFRFKKVGQSPNSSGIYTRQGIYMNGTTVVNYSDSTNTAGDVSMALANGKTQSTVDIFEPFDGVHTGWLTNGVSTHNTSSYAYRTMVGGVARTADSFESLNLYVQGAGTVTGTIQVYGYRN